MSDLPHPGRRSKTSKGESDGSFWRPGDLRETHGFASRSRDRFAFVDEMSRKREGIDFEEKDGTSSSERRFPVPHRVKFCGHLSTGNLGSVAPEVKRFFRIFVRPEVGSD